LPNRSIGEQSILLESGEPTNAAIDHSADPLANAVCQLSGSIVAIRNGATLCQLLEHGDLELIEIVRLPHGSPPFSQDSRRSGALHITLANQPSRHNHEINAW
jgi:hypothetical protein